MARGTTLTRMLEMLRAETRASLNPAHNAQMRDEQVIALQEAQKELWEDYEWPFLRVERTEQLLTGTRFYDPPTDMNIDRIEKIEVRWGGQWLELVEGIGADQLSTWDSELDEQSWPVERWRIYEDEQIEVWPVPSDSGTLSDLEGYLKFTGIRNLRPLTDQAHVCDLDDRLIVLKAAIRYVKATEQRIVLENFRTRLGQLRANYSPRRNFRMFGKQEAGRALRGPPRVHYRVNET
jgi:hypothetical protein